MNSLTKNLAVTTYQSFIATRILAPKILNRTVGYKSALSLGHLYPNSSLKLTTPTKAPLEGNTEFNGYIPVEELDIIYSRSSGPGGQNVNKVNTKVEVRFNLQSAKWISDKAKHKMAEKFQAKLTKDGYLIFRSDLTRTQHLNLADCLEKIRRSVRDSLKEPAELSAETEEKIRRRLERAAHERLAMKRHRSEIKNDKRRPDNVSL